MPATDDDKYAKFEAAKKVAPPPVPGPSAPALDFDDKYSKSCGNHIPDSLKKYHSAMDLMNLDTLPVEYVLFACFVVISGMVVSFGFGRVFDVDTIERFSALQ